MTGPHKTGKAAPGSPVPGLPGLLAAVLLTAVVLTLAAAGTVASPAVKRTSHIPLPSSFGAVADFCFAGAGSCSAGPVQCCNSVQPAGSPAAVDALGPLGIVLKDLNIPIGLTCTPISVIGGGIGSSW